MNNVLFISQSSQASGYGSAQQEADFGDKIEEMERDEDRVLTIRFEAGTSKTLRWKFKPQQKEVKVSIFFLYYFWYLC